MKKLILACVVMATLILCGLFAYRYYEANHSFTPWLARVQFQLWLNENVNGKPLYISAAEGRVHDGISEWRVRTAPAPTHVEWYWYWWYDMDQKFYKARVNDLVQKKGFKQIWVQSFVNEKEEQDYQSVFLKIVNNDYDGVQKLLEHGAEIYDWNIPDAMANHQPHLVKLLWDHAKNRGSELRYEISQGATVAQVEAMLKNGVSAEPPEDDLIDPLGVASANGDLPMIQLLLAHGGDPNWHGRMPIGRYTALGLAVDGRRLDIVTYLLDHGGQPNPGAMIGALMKCLKVYSESQRQVSMQIVQLLVAHGALNHLPQNRGIYLYLACANVADPALVKLLLDHGSNPDDVAIDGQGTAPVIQQVREAIAGKDKKGPRPELQPILALLQAADNGRGTSTTPAGAILYANNSLSTASLETLLGKSVNVTTDIQVDSTQDSKLPSYMISSTPKGRVYTGRLDIVKTSSITLSAPASPTSGPGDRRLVVIKRSHIKRIVASAAGILATPQTILPTPHYQ